MWADTMDLPIKVIDVDGLRHSHQSYLSSNAKIVLHESKLRIVRIDSNKPSCAQSQGCYDFNSLTDNSFVPILSRKQQCLKTSSNCGNRLFSTTPGDSTRRHSIRVFLSRPLLERASSSFIHSPSPSRPAQSGAGSLPYLL